MMNYNEVYFENAEKERKFQTALENTANASLFSGDSSQSNFFSNSASMQSVHAESSSDIQGLSRISLPKDDHCLYRAVSLYLFDADVPSLRLIVAKTLENNLDYFLEFIQLPQNVPMQQLIENIRSGNEWAGEVEIQILMHILQRPIVVLDNNGKIRNQAGIEQYLAQPPIFVYYDDVNHYDGLLLNENNGRELLEQLQLEQNNAASASNRNAVISNQ